MAAFLERLTMRGQTALLSLAGAVFTLAACATAPTSPDVAYVVPDSSVEARSTVEAPERSAQTFQSIDEIYPVAVVAARPGAPLAEAPRALDQTITLGGRSLSLEDALTETFTNAFLVMKDGEIVYERYFNGADAETQFIGWSISKSVTSILVGLALEDGAIASLDDPVELYLSELEGTAFEGATILNLLEMRGGTSYTEQSRSGPPSVNILANRALFQQQARFTDIADLGLERLHPPGEAFNYSTLTASLLGKVVESATGETLAAYMSRRLWQPAGMQDEAYWMLDGPPGEGDEFAGGGVNATARDFARLGQMMLDGGRVGDVQVVPEDWVAASTVHTREEPVIPGAPRGYGYMWWTFVGLDLFEAVGVHGQFISVDPVTNTVIVKLSYWPERGSGPRAMESHQLFTQVRAQLAD
ncbi:MAG: beta-lactamase family protein [Hyphomonadaceae bacterium]|nr:beta-lactamase family protein [Hyphomonadaceae bacterium]